MRKSWSLASIAGDWAFNIGASLEFWNWTTPDWKYPPGLAYMLSVLAALVFSAGLWTVIRLEKHRDRANPIAGSARTCWILLATGFAILALSFPVYLMLGSARMLWRTPVSIRSRQRNRDGVQPGVGVLCALGAKRQDCPRDRGGRGDHVFRKCFCDSKGWISSLELGTASDRNARSLAIRSRRCAWDAYRAHQCSAGQ